MSKAKRRRTAKSFAHPSPLCPLLTASSKDGHPSLNIAQLPYHSQATGDSCFGLCPVGSGQRSEGSAENEKKFKLF